MRVHVYGLSLFGYAATSLQTDNIMCGLSFARQITGVKE
ncbi:hypothetical protein IMSAGC006_01293 [Muribaculaceae bacterium]|nr:hypothetical protein IMSAGC006_01293 [Muribaculaceae bacterium]